MQRTAYRPEIDGLRAIAVVSVVLYHAELYIGTFQILGGGLLGVDLFFVISGYLITKIIVTEMDQQNFSFITFYDRRVRRILPALFVVLLVSIPFALVYLLPSALVSFSQETLATIGFVSNYYFWITGQKYGAETAAFIPLLHTWSLSVEEQFYIIYPLALMGVWRWARKYFLTLALACLLLSLQLADFSSARNPTMAFFIFPTRAWELLAGGVLAWLEYQYGRKTNNALSATMPLLGAFLIAHSVFLFDPTNHHPSFFTVVPIIGVCLIIWFSGGRDLTTRVLSFKPIVFVGLISYSLYLWHYPVFVFGRMIDAVPVGFNKLAWVSNDSLIEKAVWIILSIGLAAITYRFVETPFRRRDDEHKFILSSAKTYSALGLALATLIGANVFILASDGISSRLPPIIAMNLTRHRVWHDLKSEDGRVCYNRKIGDHCVFNADAAIPFYIVGDSHMASIMADLRTRVTSSGYRYITLTSSGCQYVRVLDRVTKIGHKVRKGCNAAFQEERRDQMLKGQKGVVVVGGRLPLLFTEDRIEIKDRDARPFRDYYQNADRTLATKKQRQEALTRHYQESVLDLADAGHIVILVYPIPEVGLNVPRRILQKYVKHKQNFEQSIMEQPLTISYERFVERNEGAFKLLDNIVHPNIRRVYPHKIVCNTFVPKRCATHNSTDIFYVDTNHPTAKFSSWINERIISSIK